MYMCQSLQMIIQFIWEPPPPKKKYYIIAYLPKIDKLSL